MSGNKKNSEDDSGIGGLGIAAAVLLGAGAAAAGYLFGAYRERQQSSSSGGGGGPRPPPSGGARPPRTDWGEKHEPNLGARKKQREAFRERSDIPDEMKCIICFDNPREVCYIPCGHVGVCEDCAEKITKMCPMCQQEFTGKKPVYL